MTAKRLMEERNRLSDNNPRWGIQPNTRIRLKESTIRKLEDITGKNTVEWGLDILNRSTENMITPRY